MVLLVAVVAGLLSGLLRAQLGKTKYRPSPLRQTGYVLAAFAAQWLIFSLPVTRTNLPDIIVRWIFVLSQLALLYFGWANRKLPGFWLLIGGLLLNLIVIALNGGLMPITPETVQWLRPDATPGSWQIGERLGFGKDIVLTQGETVLWFLSDHFRSFSNLSYRVAFSLGDVFIALGAFWLFWASGRPAQNQSLQEINNEPEQPPSFQ
jgi:protein-S-isoprenylcysteine O-methyltransferase Ste14